MSEENEDYWMERESQEEERAAEREEVRYENAIIHNY